MILMMSSVTLSSNAFITLTLSVRLNLDFSRNLSPAALEKEKSAFFLFCPKHSKQKQPKLAQNVDNELKVKNEDAKGPLKNDFTEKN